MFRKKTTTDSLTHQGIELRGQVTTWYVFGFPVRTRRTEYWSKGGEFHLGAGSIEGIRERQMKMQAREAFIAAVWDSNEREQP